MVGEICHIQAARPDGPRYDPHQSAGERHGYDNLVLLCANHHKVIDDDPVAYSMERLRQIKSDHEAHHADLASSEIERGARLLIDQSVIAVNQTGGIAAHTVHQTIHVHPPTDSGVSPRVAALCRLRGFHRERIDKITAAAAPVELLDGGMLVLHVLPLSSAEQSRAQAFAEISQQPGRFPPIKGSVLGTRINHEGMLTASNAKGFKEPQRAYVMVFLSGALEAVASSLSRGADQRFMLLPDIEAMIVEYAALYTRRPAACGIEPPFAVFVSLIDVKDREMLHTSIPVGAFPEDLPSGTLAAERLDFQECLFETEPADAQACATLLRPILDHLANAAGLTKTTCFDDAGVYIPEPDR